MRVEQIEYITAVARLRSFRGAAEELHISQPALSETVRNLERELGVVILDRGRSGVRISDEGRELLPHMLDVIEAVDSLRRAADDQHQGSRVVRLGTVTAATAPLLTPTMRRFHDAHPAIQVEVVVAQQERIHRKLLEGGLDLGLVNYLEGDDMPPNLDTTELLRGRPVVCIRGDHALAAKAAVHPRDLAGVSLIAMRYLHRLLGDRPPAFSYSADGAEMGKLMVAEGLGAAVLPDYSVIGDPLEQRGAITFRAIEDDTDVMLMVQRRGGGTATGAAQDLHALFVDHAQAVTAPT